jgi:ABC-type polysaccharide/polyol phosphate transport system ATPase subunit
MAEYSVIAENLTKSYKMYNSAADKLKDLILPREYGRDFLALKNLSFKVEKGEVVGLLGLNGSGKSTLSSILGGISMPTSGKILIDGEPAFIAISSGLNNQLTGIENIEFKGLMLGMSKSKIQQITQDIIDFADIGEFIYQPVKTYSSGMKSRLGFAISVNIDPDILIIDEALSVGDPTFTQKCLEKMMEFKLSGKTIFFVSHSLSQVREFCTKAMWIEYGVLKLFGEVNEVADKYQEFLNDYNKMSKEEKLHYKQKMIENRNHLLLGEYQNQTSKTEYKIKTSGKIFKHVTLLKGKDLKIIPYNFDFVTFAFSVFSALYRRDIKSLLSIFGIMVVSLFLFSKPFVGYVMLMAIFSAISGKIYTNFLINKKGYTPYQYGESKEKITKCLINKKIKMYKYLNIASIVIFVILCISIFLIGSKIDNLKIIPNKAKSNVDMPVNNGVESRIYNFTVARVNPENFSNYWRNPVLSPKYKNNAVVNSLYLIKINGNNFEVNIQQIPSKLQVSYPDRDYTDELLYSYAEGGSEYLTRLIEQNYGFKSDNLFIMNDDEVNKLFGLMDIKGSVKKNTLDINVSTTRYKLDNIESSQMIDQSQMSSMVYNIFINLLNSDRERFSKVKEYIKTINSELNAEVLDSLYESYNKAVAEKGQNFSKLITNQTSLHTVKLSDVIDMDNKNIVNKARLSNHEIYLNNGDYKNNIFYKLINK